MLGEYRTLLIHKLKTMHIADVLTHVNTVLY